MFYRMDRFRALKSQKLGFWGKTEHHDVTIERSQSDKQK